MSTSEETDIRRTVMIFNHRMVLINVMSLEATEKANTDDRIAAAGAPDLPGVGCSSTTKHEDDANVRAHGHAQAMPRQFNWISALGLGFSITNSWVGYLVSQLLPRASRAG